MYLKNDASRLIEINHVLNDGLENGRVIKVVHSFLERNIDGVSASIFRANFVHVAGSGEEIVSILMEGHRHYPEENKRSKFSSDVLTSSLGYSMRRRISFKGHVKCLSVRRPASNRQWWP